MNEIKSIHSPESRFSQSQIDAAFSEIAGSARIARTLCTEAIAAPPEDLESQADLMVATRAILDRIGWVADLHTEKLNRVVGNAADWMLPPVYHRAGKANDAD